MPLMEGFMPGDNPAAYTSLAELIDANAGKGGAAIAKMAEEAGFALPSAEGAPSMAADGGDLMAEESAPFDPAKKDERMMDAATKNLEKFSKKPEGESASPGKMEA